MYIKPENQIIISGEIKCDFNISKILFLKKFKSHLRNNTNSKEILIIKIFLNFVEQINRKSGGI